MLLLGKFNLKKSDEKVPIMLKHPKLAPYLKKSQIYYFLLNLRHLFLKIDTILHIKV